MKNVGRMVLTLSSFIFIAVSAIHSGSAHASSTTTANAVTAKTFLVDENSPLVNADRGMAIGKTTSSITVPGETYCFEDGASKQAVQVLGIFVDSSADTSNKGTRFPPYVFMVGSSQPGGGACFSDFQDTGSSCTISVNGQERSFKKYTVACDGCAAQ